MLNRLIYKITLASFIILTICFNSINLKASMYPAIGVQVGTLGAGVNISQPISTHFNLRINANGLGGNYKNKIEAIEYKATLNFINLGLLADYYPFNSGFYITGGAYYNGNNIKLKSNVAPNQTIEIGGQTFNTNDLGNNGLNGKLSFNKINPYFGLGYAANNINSKGLTLVGELGILFTGAPKLSYNVDCSDTISATGICKQLIDAAAREKAKVDNKFNKARVYPVAYLGLAYKF